MDATAFRAQRDEDLTGSDERLEPIVAQALLNRPAADWYAPIVDEAAQIWVEYHQAEAPGANFRPALERFREALSDSLEKTSENTHSGRVARWVSTFTVNDGTITGAYARGIRFKMWRSMRDGDVRELHVGVDGQLRPIGGLFDLGVARLPYPGAPTGPAEAWIECRCVAQPASREGEAMSSTTFGLGGDAFADDEVPIANPDGTPYTGALIVLLPAASDPTVAASSEPAHATTVWLGEAADLDEAARAAIAGEVRSYATALDGPVVVPVMKRGTLGDDDADVVFLERTDAILALRDGLMESSPVLMAAHDAAEQFPEWTPHVTLGYPDRPARAEYDGEEVTFDRIGLWLGGDHYEYPMGGALTAAAFDMAGVIADVEPEGLAEPDLDDEDEEEITEIPVHGVLAPEGVLTGDGRGFREGALSTRPLPVPLRLEVVGSHGGNQTSEVVTVGRVDEAWRDDATGMWRFRGAIILSKEYADRAIEGIIDRSGLGVSIDADDMSVDLEGFEQEIELAQTEGRQPNTWFSNARVAGLTIVPIPAFYEAYVGLGHEFEEDLTEEEVVEAEAALTACGCADGLAIVDLTGLSEEELAAYDALSAEEQDAYARDRGLMSMAQQAPGVKADGSPPKCEYGDEPATKYVLHSEGMAYVPTCDEHLERARADAAATTPSGEPDESNIDRIGDYGTSFAAPGSFAPGTKDGPGWITHPTATARIRRYWVRGEGAAKIRWGAPGDFNRCRRQLAKYVQRPDWLAGLCANMHKEALGIWPGQHRGNHAIAASAGAPAPIFSLVASAGDAWGPFPAEFFQDPKFDRVTPMHIDKESGRVWGHLADWSTCHVGIPGVCTTPPRSASNYAHFLKGVVETTAGDQPVGTLTFGVGHPDLRMRASSAVAHYDRMEAVFAYVNVGEDSFGIWYSGVLRPGLSESTLNEIRAIGQLSGDWRHFPRYGQDLIAAVAVNTGGFPIPALAASASGITALVAAGVVPPEVSQAGTAFSADSEENEKFLARAVTRALGMIEEKKRAEAARGRLLAMRLAKARDRIKEG